MLKCGFSPVYDHNSRMLVLGSFPSVKSRLENFYYANKNNRFWRVLGECLPSLPGEIPKERRDYLINHRIALWDIVKSCTVKGSSDVTIKPVEIVDLNVILNIAPIEKILCNGITAYRLTLANYSLNIPIICLPSTSSANVRFDINPWIRELAACY